MKKAVIIGDSYSTFEGYIPEGYAIYYSDKECDNTDVRRVEETWWKRLEDKGVMHVVHNNSWSGSTICYTAYGERDCSGDSSFIFRANQLIENGFFEKNGIDTVIIFGGTNDSWANSPLGELKFDGIERNDLFCVLPAISYLVKILREAMPSLEIICVANTEIKDEIIHATGVAAEHYGAKYVKLCDIDKRCGHPTIKGMGEIAQQVEKALV